LQKYYPFDPANRDKYVVHDDYRPTWEVPTLARYKFQIGARFLKRNSVPLALFAQPDPS
jgi:hypothetical protein